VEKLISYSLSLPVAACTIGMPELAHIEQNIQVAKAFKPLSRNEMDSMNAKMLPLKASIDHFFSNHIDC
jgi:predicted aldo/keto reductase-like oxidoreductase